MEQNFFNQIKEEVAAYGKAVGNAGKYHLIGVVSRMLGLFLLMLTVVLCAIVFLTFCAVAAVAALATCMPVWAAALTVGSFFALLIVIALIWRKPLFVHPFIRRFSKQIRTEEELAQRTTEALHQAEIQRVRIECHADEAAREMKYYAGLLSRMWQAVKGQGNSDE